MIQIVHGDPDEKLSGATSSFFILPFRYKITDIANKDCPELFYKEIDTNSNDEQWTERKRYFNRETACVLFEHTKRFRITPSTWESSDESIYPKLIEFKPEKETVYKVKIAPPEIVLFEISDSDFKKAEKSDIFQSGFLIVKTYFISESGKQAPSFENLLHFNERFRYWRKLYDKHDGKLRELSNLIGNRSNLTKEEETLELYLRRWQRLLTIPFSHTAGGKQQFYQFFPDQWCQDAEQWFLDELGTSSTNHKETGWIIFNDNRTFVWSNAVLAGGADILQKLNPDNNVVTEPEAFGHWVKLLNVDHPSSDNWWSSDNDLQLNDVTSFEKRWCANRTYTRWAQRGTLYGFNYHSGVMLSGKCHEPPLSTTFRRHYFDMILLMLYLRNTIFRFSNEINVLTAPVRLGQKKNWRQRFLVILTAPVRLFIKKNWERNFLVIRKEFAIFTNLYQFPLISNQQQMLEMYQIARKHLDIDELFHEVEEEIRNTHDYFSAEKSNQLNNIMLWLTVIATVSALYALPWKEFLFS